MKLRFILTLIAIGAMHPCHAEAQTDVAPVIRTNLVPAAEHFREVNGQLYNTQRSVLWTNFEGKCLTVSSKGIVIETFTMEPVYEASSRSIETRNYLGRVTSSRIVPTTVQIGTKKVPGMKYILLNYPANRNPTVGNPISFRAMRVGTTNYGNDTLELLDCGKPHIVPVVSTNYSHVSK